MPRIFQLAVDHHITSTLTLVESNSHIAGCTLVHLIKKRWWSEEPSILRTDFAAKRNRITTLRQRGEDTTQAREIASVARRTYLDEIDSAQATALAQWCQ